MRFFGFSLFSFLPHVQHLSKGARRGEGEQQGTVAASLKRVTTSHHHSEQQGVAISSSGSDEDSVQYREVKEGEGGKEIDRSSNGGEKGVETDEPA